MTLANSIRPEDLPVVIRALQPVDGQISREAAQTALDSDYSALPALTIIQAEVENARAALQEHLEGEDINLPPSAKEVLDRVTQILSDIHALPPGEGAVLPSELRRTQVEEAVNTSDTCRKTAQALLDHMKKSGVASLSDCYNELLTYSKERADIIWDMLCADSHIIHEMMRVNEDLAGDIQKTTGKSEKEAYEIARREVEERVTYKPGGKYINKKTTAAILLQIITHKLEEEFMAILQQSVKKGELPLLKDGKCLETEEDQDRFAMSMTVSTNMKYMDTQRYRDSIDNDLGRAQTEHAGKADAFFRSREAIAGGAENGKDLQNNFGYVYLSAEQADEFEIAEEIQIRERHGKVMSFTYMGEPYVAVPIGYYWTMRCDHEYGEAIFLLEELADDPIYKGTPVATYYKALVDYYEFGTEQKYRNDEDFIRGYHEACYAAERAWIDYVRYAREAKLPYIHVHPFETYATPSTKSHDFTLGVINHDENERYSEGQRKFIENARYFFDSTGLTVMYPEMIMKTLELAGQAVCVSLSSRVGNSQGAYLAQNIPNEEAGRENGMATLFDTQFAMRILPTSSGKLMKKADPIGAFGQRFEDALGDTETFWLSFIGKTLAHELAHNFFKGAEKVYSGDDRGLAGLLAEEAKATAGLSCTLERPEDLTDTDVETLRTMMPYTLRSLLRLMPASRKAHNSNQYLREGAVLLDHLVQSGVLEIARVRLNENGEPEVIDINDTEEYDFEFLRTNMDKSALQDMISRNNAFIVQLGHLYAQTQGYVPLPENNIVPDMTDYDLWQALSIRCHEDEIAELKNKGDSASLEKAEALETALQKITPPSDPTMTTQVEALLRYVDYTSPDRMRAAVARVHNLDSETQSAEIDTEVTKLQGAIEVKWPAYHINGAPA